MKTIRFVPLLCSFLLCQGCIIFYHYKDLSLYQKDFNKSKLKTDGYYINSYKNKYYPRTLQADFVSLYEDGTYVYYYSDYIDKKFETNYYQPYFYDDLTSIGSWGCYVIEGDTIKIQKFWLSTPGSFIPIWKVCTKVGVILNDTTFRLTKIVYHDRVDKIDETYYFRPCVDCKPDSSKSIINVHLKKLGKRRNYWISPLFTRKVK